MTGVAIRFEIDTSVAGVALRALRAVADNLVPLLEDIGTELQESTFLRFDTNIAPDGTPWIPSAAATARGSPTLVDQAHLRDSVHYVVDGATAVEIGAGGVAGAYAALHQFGIDEDVPVKAYARAFSQVFGKPISGVAQVKAHTRHMTMPARPYLGISAEDEASVEAIVVDHWRQAVVRGIG